MAGGNDMRMSQDILVVEDEESLRVNVSRYLVSQGHQVEAAADATSARAMLAKRGYDIMITDLRLPDGDGMELLEEASTISPGTIVLVMTAFGTLDSAIRAFRHGAYDYLPKPFSLDELGASSHTSLATSA